MNNLREKLSEKKTILGCLVCLTDPCLCEIMGYIGYDCVWIDTEHTYTSYKEVLCHLNAAKAADIPAVIRLPQNDLTATKKILEMGPDGIIFPMAKTAAEINSLIEMTLYPPLGTRGFGPMRAIRYGADNAKTYTEKDSLSLCRFVQIEHIDMIAELDEILKNPYIDGFIFGPNDLSGSLGDFLNVYGDATFSQIEKATEKVKKSGKIIGLAGGMGESDIAKWSALGLDMLFCGGDWNFVYAKGKDVLETMKKYNK